MSTTQHPQPAPDGDNPRAHQVTPEVLGSSCIANAAIIPDLAGALEPAVQDAVERDMPGVVIG